MYAYIGRQAIYGKDLMIAGYELLYRSGGGGNSVKILDGDAATREVLSDAVNVFGISQLTDGLPAFINFTRNLILDDFAFLASPKDIVVEVPGDITVDELLIDKFSSLRRAGYRLVLDSYSEFNGVLRFNEILPLFDIIRIDVRAHSRLQLTNIIRKLRRSHAKLLAEHIETEEDFDTALALDFALFQGYYFEKPIRLSKQLPPLSQSSYGQLLNELLRPIIDFDRCAEIIYRDALMAYMFLRQTQAAASYQGNSLEEIQRGMLLMGTDELLRWVCLVLLKQNNATSTDEIGRRAFQRGRFTELLVENADIPVSSQSGFLMGLFSLLDKVMNVRTESLLEGMQLPRGMKDALLGRGENEYSQVLMYVVIFEMANPRLLLPDIHLRIEQEAVSRLYMSSITDTDTAFTSVGPRVVRAYSGNILRQPNILKGANGEETQER